MTWNHFKVITRNTPHRRNRGKQALDTFSIQDGVYNKSVNEFTFEIGQSLVSIGNCSLDDAGFELAIRCWLDDRQRFYIKLLMTRLDAPQLKRVRYSVWEEITREQSVAIFQKHGGT